MSTSSSSGDYGRFDELAEEFAERYRRGDRPSLQEYIDRLPEMADLDDYREGLAHDASDTVHWMVAAVFYLQLGDVEGCRRHARAMLDAFGTTDNPETAERTAKIGLVTVPPAEEARRLTALADLAVARGSDSPNLPWFQLTRGIAAYRDALFHDAANWLQKVCASTGSSPECKTAALMFLAMSQSRLGEPSEARASLEIARRSLKAMSRRGGGHDRLICEISLREAEGLIGH